jgi:quercetin dioxygenase-like cupin family protein
MASPTFQVGQIQVDFHVEAEDSDGGLTMFECLVPVAARVPVAHSHDAFDETVYVLEGACSWSVDGETHELGPGEAMCIRRGQVHAFENRGDADVRFLAVATPGVFGPDYFREIGEAIAAAAGGPPDPAALGEVMRRHGLTPAPPPSA